MGLSAVWDDRGLAAAVGGQITIVGCLGTLITGDGHLVAPELEHPDTDHVGAATDHSDRAGIEPAPVAFL